MACSSCNCCREQTKQNCQNQDNNPELVYEVRKLSGLIQVLQTEIHTSEKTPYWLTTREAAEYARVSIKKISRAVKSGKLKCGNRDGHWRFKHEWIDKYIINN